MKQLKRKAQSLTEYTIVAGIIAIVLVAMGTPFRRSVQRVLKDVADVMGLQSEAETASADPREASLINSLTDSSLQRSDLRQDTVGVYNFSIQSESWINTEAHTDLGSIND